MSFLRKRLQRATKWKYLFYLHSIFHRCDAMSLKSGKIVIIFCLKFFEEPWIHIKLNREFDNCAAGIITFLKKIDHVTTTKMLNSSPVNQSESPCYVFVR